jgi:hypothetical protein
VLVIFVAVDGEDFAWKIIRRAQNGIKSEGRERKIKGFINIGVIMYLR